MYENLGVSELLEIYKNGSPRERDMAMELIITNNDSLIISIINKYFHSYCHNYIEDMRQEGRQAMFEHVLDFDPERGMFSTFITPYIVDAIKTYICSVHGISTHYASQIKRYNRAIAELKQSGVANPTFGAIAEKMGVGLDAVQRVHGMATHMNFVSIEGDNKDKEISSPLNTSPDVICEREEESATLAKAIEELPEMERAVIRETFFSESGKDAALVDVARKLGTDVSTVRRLKNLALRRMQESATLREYGISKQRRELEDYAESLTVTFVLPEDVVSANVEIALTVEDGGEIRI